MPDDDFNVFTDEDKRSVAYGVCALGQVAIGATVGSIAGGQTLLGAAGGAVWGLFTCRYLQEPIKRKLFSENGRLTEYDFGRRAVRMVFEHRGDYPSQWAAIRRSGRLRRRSGARWRRCVAGCAKPSGTRESGLV